MSAFAITFGCGRMLAVNSAPTGPAVGWRPFRWTVREDEAEKFSSIEKARTFGEEHLQHDRFGTRAIAPRRPGPPSPGGSAPALMMAA